MDLVKILTEQLNISSDQAEQGAGMLFSKLKDGLDTDDFSKIAGAIPGLDDLIGKAPAADASESGGLMGMIGGAASKLGMGNVGDMADLVTGFDKLGLDASQLKGFVTVVLQFLEDRLGVDAKALVEKYLQ